jgi:hypothetical protein
MQNTNTYHRHGDMAMRRQGEAVENVGMPTFFWGAAVGRFWGTKENAGKGEELRKRKRDFSLRRLRSE